MEQAKLKENKMKKLMIAAVAAAIVGGVYAALPEKDADIDGNGVGVMHNLSIKVKTLMPASTTGKSSGCPICPEPGKTCYYFEQGSLTVNGIFASCDCEDMFKYGYFWLGSGKKATKLLHRLPADAENYDDLPELSDVFTVSRYSKNNKKAVGELSYGEDGDDVILAGVGFGSYTDAKYKVTKDDEILLKTPAKVSVSGNVIGAIKTDKILAYKGIVRGDDDEREWKLYAVDSACTVAVNCEDDGEEPDAVPFVGTFSVKSTSVKALKKIIPADCWEAAN